MNNYKTFPNNACTIEKKSERSVLRDMLSDSNNQCIISAGRLCSHSEILWQVSA